MCFHVTDMNGVHYGDCSDVSGSTLESLLLGMSLPCGNTAHTMHLRTSSLSYFHPVEFSISPLLSEICFQSDVTVALHCGVHFRHFRE
ncbi:hypothetical protein Pelo_19042 [Pelomyxa schiedti]|nr:hypothetical protein Pelo_19042 [Pelomyxa schiedti]